LRTTRPRRPDRYAGGQRSEDSVNSSWAPFTIQRKSGRQGFASTIDNWGVKQLWVADRSIVPALASGNINLAAVMIGEKASDMTIHDARP
jgi:hypothetical protein